MVLAIGLFPAQLSQASNYDVEVDPIAVALRGYSLHLGLSDLAFGRFDLGVYGMKFPASIVPSEKFKASFTGFGAKWDFVPTAETGLFYGIETSRNSIRATLIETSESVVSTEITAGGPVGNR